MTDNVPGENKDKVIKALRSEAATQRIVVSHLETQKKIRPENKDKVIELLRSEVAVIRNLKDALNLEEDN